MTINKKLKVLFVASEIDPLVKVGGLGDVIGSLPKKIQKNNCEIKIIVPFYKIVEENLKNNNFKTKKLDIYIHVRTNLIDYIFEVTEVKKNGIKIYLLQNKELFDRDYVYSTPQGDYSDNCARFGAFSLAALQTSRKLNYKPDIIHCHDWETSFIPIYIKNAKHLLPSLNYFENTKIVFTIHNLAYQGIYEPHFLDVLGLPSYTFSLEGLEFYGNVNLMKGGINYSDLITTVSPTYCEEIQTPSHGEGLEGVISESSVKYNKLKGIINGIDYDKWNPNTDSSLYMNYEIQDIEKKYINKQELKKQFGLDLNDNIPLIGMVCRLAAQKGVDLVMESLDLIFKLGYQLIIIGSGEERFMTMLAKANQRYKGRFWSLVKYNDKIARRIYAGSDMFLMPSRFEPCGLGQLIALRYGTIPIVRATGGLMDTIIDYSKNKKSGFGFVFNEFSVASLIEALNQAKGIYNSKTEWQKIVTRGMRKRFSWDKSSKIYVQEYNKLVSNH